MPIRVKFAPDGARVFVSNVVSDALTVFDAKTRELIGKVSTRPGSAPAPGPVGLLPTPDGARLFFAHTSRDEVGVIDPHTLALLQWLDAGDEPDGMAWVP
jgi:YVTN family beta-propeller protein